jgi:hypothetical protein
MILIRSINSIANFSTLVKSKPPPTHTKKMSLSRSKSQHRSPRDDLCSPHVRYLHCTSRPAIRIAPLPLRMFLCTSQMPAVIVKPPQTARFLHPDAWTLLRISPNQCPGSAHIYAPLCILGNLCCISASFLDCAVRITCDPSDTLSVEFEQSLFYTTEDIIRSIRAIRVP